mgnify:CR=1 FL=1
MDKRLVFLMCLLVFLLATICYIVMKGDYFSVAHDITITSVTVSKSEAYAGDVVNITVSAKNKGSATETFNVTCFYNITAIETQTVSDLLAGEDANLTFSWDTTNISPANYVINAEASKVPGETNTADNTYIAGTILVKAQAVLYVNPQNNAVTVGQSFTVNITILDVANLYGYEFELKYNTTILNMLNITEGDFLKQSGNTFFYPEINSTEGYAYVVSMLLGDIPGVNGNGTLVAITFEAVAEGTSSIDLHDTKLRDSQPKPIPHLTVDGSAEV